MSPPVLAFITHTGPIKSRDAQTQIRKHVMKDIGRSRRKTGRREKGLALEFTLEVLVEIDIFNVQKPQPRLADVDQTIESILPANFNDNQSSLGSSCISESIDSKHGSRREVSAVPYIDRTWTGRMDPFIKYPMR